MLVAATVVILSILGVVALSQGDDPLTPTDVRLEAWVPYWVAERATVDLRSRAELLREVSPFWFQATGATTIGVDPNASSTTTDAFLAEARSTRLRIVPSVIDAMPAGGMAAVLADPATRTQHVDALVAFVDDGDFDGLDLDYEQFAFADGRSTWAATRPNWVAFVTELAGRLRERGHTLTVSIPPVYDDGRSDDSGYWVYDYGAIAPVVDRIRVMAYDYSTSTPGPVAPIDFVSRVARGAVEASGAPEKLVLGIPLYGYNWPVSTTGTCPEGQDVGRTSVTAATVAELVQRRSGNPVHDPATGEWSFTYQLTVSDATTSCTQTREVHYLDGEGARQRIQIAREAQFGGVSLWALGFDDDAAWAAIDPVIRTQSVVASPPESSLPS